jgi:hypothetical protein
MTEEKADWKWVPGQGVLDATTVMMRCGGDILVPCIYVLLPTYLIFKHALQRQRLDELCVYSLVEGELRTSLQLKNGVSIFQFVLVMFI